MQLFRSKKYSNIISLGAFCFTAQELIRFNIRQKAYPFDWIISDIQTVMSLISNHFENFVNTNYLTKLDDNDLKTIYNNTAYSLLRFIHDYNETLSNSAEIEQKYNRRIKRFYNDISRPTLFVRYIIDGKDYENTLKNHIRFLKLLKTYNKHNDIVYVINNNTQIKRFKNWLIGMKLFTVEKDIDYTIAKQFLDKNSKLKTIILRGFENV